jgi:hypothetical protein
MQRPQREVIEEETHRVFLCDLRVLCGEIQPRAKNAKGILHHGKCRGRREK